MAIETVLFLTLSLVRITVVKKYCNDFMIVLECIHEKDYHITCSDFVTFDIDIQHASAEAASTLYLLNSTWVVS